MKKRKTMNKKPTLFDVFEALIDRLDRIQKDIDDLKNRRVDVNIESKIKSEDILLVTKRGDNDTKRFG